jgi:hypothetical protein
VRLKPEKRSMERRKRGKRDKVIGQMDKKWQGRLAKALAIEKAKMENRIHNKYKK